MITVVAKRAGDLQQLSKQVNVVTVSDYPDVPSRLPLILDLRPSSGLMWIRPNTADVLIKKKKLCPQSLSLISDTIKQTGSFISTPAIISLETGSLLQLHTPVQTQTSELEEDHII